MKNNTLKNEEVLHKNLRDHSHDFNFFSHLQSKAQSEGLECTIQCPVKKNVPEPEQKQDESQIREDYFESFPVNPIRYRNKKQLYIGSTSGEENLSSEVKLNYFTIIKMLFSEIQELPSLGVNVIDTIFYNSDGSMVYVYTDLKRGLVKTKSKNYSQLFFRRKTEINSMSWGQGLEHIDKKTKLKQSIDPYENTFLKNYNYVALLRYKDQNFIRLKEDEFKSLFIRPVQANQKYKISGNALYLQMIPDIVNYEENTLFTVEFKLQCHKDSQLYNMAVQKHLEETSFIYGDKVKKYKEKLKRIDRDCYLLYIIFEMHGFMQIHYRKQLESGTFEFMKIGGEYYLANIRNIKIIQSKQISHSYNKASLFLNTIFDSPNNLPESLLVKTFAQIFDTENNKISQNVRNYVKNKLDQIQNKKDQQESQKVFAALNSECQQDLHQFFAHHQKYRCFIRQKQNNFDRTSPLTTISNLTVSKLKFKPDRNNKITKVPQKLQKKKNPFFQSQAIPRIQNQSKWKVSSKSKN